MRRGIAMRGGGAATRRSVPKNRSKLDRFLRAHGIKPARLARESGFSRQHLLRIRSGLVNPSTTCAAALFAALGRLAPRRVTLHDLFPRRVVLAMEREARAVLTALGDGTHARGKEDA